MQIKKILRKTFLYSIYHHIRVSTSFDSRSKKNLSKKGILYLDKLEKLLVANDIEHFFDFGTLLGLVREKGIIKGDGDIDIGVIINDKSDIDKISKLVKDRNIKKVRQFEIAEYGIAEQSYSYKNQIRFDLHYYYKEQDNRFCFLFYCLPEKTYQPNTFDVVKVKLNEFKIKSTKINDMCLSLPEDPESIVIKKYGKNWRIPDSSWPYWEGPCSEKTDFIGKTTIYIK